MILETESSWGKPALEVRGNFTWGLIAKQEDEVSEEEEERVEREQREKKEEQELEYDAKLAKEHEQKAR